MKAKEILQHKANIELRILKENGFSTGNIERAMAEYAKVKCKEQRKLCYKSHWDMSCSYPDAQFEEDNIRDAIIDAPEPKFD